MQRPEMDITGTIRKRRSVRTYEDRALTEADRKKLMDFGKTLENPFGVPVRIHMADRQTAAGGEKLGTYGTIRGARTFLGVSVPQERNALLAAGYEFETLILYATAMGLGTVWLAATFSRSSFEKAMGIEPDEWFPAISPVGYPAQKRSFRETVMRAAMKSSDRRPWEELFFQGEMGVPLTRQEAGAYAECLEMVRLAPSATNQQPWRVVRQGKDFHFYETHPAGASEDEKKIKQVDLGIALAHFHLTALEQGLKGRFERVPEAEANLPGHTWYGITWRAE